ncbi:hypothetical protein, partial [Escherichia coli]|uniref:hypothetical protein n=1 Tax=Escherichia coli TaxID=562 RepID=UPI0034E5DEBF
MRFVEDQVHWVGGNELSKGSLDPHQLIIGDEEATSAAFKGGTDTHLAINQRDEFLHQLLVRRRQ